MKTSNTISRWQLVVGFGLAVAAIISVGQGLRLGMMQSTDMQWWGAHLLANKVDVYHLLLANRETPAFMNQVPNYLQELYVGFLPLGMLRFETARILWALLNLAFAVASVLLLGWVYALDRWKHFLLLTLFFCGTPCRLTIHTGQMALLELFLITLVLTWPASSGIPLGLSYFKYSFSPIFVAYAFGKRAWRILALSVLPPLIGFFIFLALVGGSPEKVALEPLMVARFGVAPGAGDFSTLISEANPSLHLAGLVIALVVSLLAGLWITKILGDIKQAAAVLSAVNLICFPHLTYDFVFLAIPLALLLSLRIRSSIFWIAIGCISVDWYAMKLVDRSVSPFLMQITTLALTLLLSGCLIKICRVPSIHLERKTA